MAASNIAASCCAAAHRKRWAGLTLSSCVLLAGVAVYLYLTIQPLVWRLTCVIDRVVSLSETPGTAGKAATAQLPTDVIEAMKTGAPYLDFASLGPALIAIMLLLLSGSCGLSAHHKLSKFCIFLADVFMLLALAFYLAVFAAGLFSDRPLFTEQWTVITTVCDERLPLIKSQLSEARSKYEAAAGDSQGKLATAQSQLETAAQQLADFEQLCECMSGVPYDLRALTGAGLAGSAAVILAYVFVNGLCCTLGCCRPARVAPEDTDGVDMAKGATADDGGEGGGEEEEEEEADGENGQ